VFSFFSDDCLAHSGGLSVPDILSEVKKLQNFAYQLGQEETKEMTRSGQLKDSVLVVP
jgi:hypothetical protein